MPGCTRLYSEFIAQDSESDSSLNGTYTGGVNNNRVPLTRLSGTNPQALSVRPDFGPLFKRHKTTGLNSRFDRMLERVNLTLQDPQTPTTISSHHGRARTRSTGSSSVSSGYDVPKTPVDAYSALEEGRLGQTFSVIKMKSASGGKFGEYYRAGEGYDEDMQFEESDQIVPVTAHKEPLPDWLSNTFSTLDPGHPLRRLIPPSTELPHEEPTFAFSHLPQHQDPSIAENVPFEHEDLQMQDWQELDLIDQQSHLHSTRIPNPDTNYSGPKMLHPIALPSFDNEDFLPPPDVDTLPLPFSTPGPSSTVSLDLFHTGSGSATSGNPMNPADQDTYGVWPPFSMPEPLSRSSINRNVLRGVVLSPPRPSPLILAQPEPVYSTTSPFSPFLYENLETNSSDSDPPPLPINVHKLPSSIHLPHIENPFSTPGPRFHVPLSRPIYFDSPTEDPADSDPLAPPEGYALDELDFRWEPFVQKNESETTDGKETRGEWDFSMDFNIKESVEHPMTMGFEVRRDTPEPTTTEDQVSMMELNPSLHPLEARYGHRPSSTQGSGQGVAPSPTPEPKKVDTAFAPAPGIFISPLRNEPNSQNLQASDIDMPLERPTSQTYIPVTPKKKLTTPIEISNTSRTQARKSTLGSRPKLKHGQTPSRISTRILPRLDTAKCRSVDSTDEWQTTPGAPKISKITDGAQEEDFSKQSVFSQISNDSIESWSQESEAWR